MIKSLPYEATGKAIKGYENSVIAKNETNDCVVRAFASSFEIPYDEAHSIVATKFNRQNRKGTYGTSSTLVKISNEKVNKLLSKTRYTISSGENALSIFTLECVNNNDKVVYCW